MSSLARRGLHTTVAVAGLAALGAGLAGPAFATPEAAPATETEAVEEAPATPDESAEEDMLADVEEDEPESELAALPELFVFEAPTAALPGGAELPATPGTDTVGDVPMPDMDESTIGENNDLNPLVPVPTGASTTAADPEEFTDSEVAEEMVRDMLDLTNDNEVNVPPSLG